MSLKELQREAVALDPVSRRELLAYLIALQDAEDKEYRKKLSSKIDDDSAGRWLSLEEAQEKLAGHG